MGFAQMDGVQKTTESRTGCSTIGQFLGPSTGSGQGLTNDARGSIVRALREMTLYEDAFNDEPEQVHNAENDQVGSQGFQ